MDVSLEQRGQQWLEQLLRLAELPSAVGTEPNPAFAEDSCWLTIDEKV